MYAKELVPFINLLQNYYAEAFTHIGEQDWRHIAAFQNEPLAQSNENIMKAIQRLAQAPQADIEDHRFDYNALFVGPDKLLAAPYETVYVSDERVLMRKATLSVRDDYLRFDLQVDRKNVEADDHAAYELAFLAKLLQLDNSKAEEGFDSFVANHLAKWVPAHVQDIRENTENEVCLGFADLLEAVCDCCASQCGVNKVDNEKEQVSQK